MTLLWHENNRAQFHVFRWFRLSFSFAFLLLMIKRWWDCYCIRFLSFPHQTHTHSHTHWIREGQFKKLIFLCWQLFFACLNLIWLNFVFKFTLVALFVSCIANLRFLVVVFFFSLSLSCPLFSSVSVHRFHSTLARVFIFLDDFYRLKECHFWGITEENSASLFRCNKHSHFFCQFAPIDYQDHAFDGICWHPNCSKVKLGMRLCSTRNVTSCTKPLRNFVFNWIPLG